ncbi:MAG: phosphoglycolate phosphatase [Hyphomicrobiales bacterium]|nr:phosphoglycolate phosphatase [Hyphomicrobiales bacterium]
MPASSPLIVFDLDGTLVDTADDLIAALNHVLALEGATTVARAAARHMVGHGARMLITRGLAADNRTVSAARLEELFQAFIAYYSAHIAVHSQVFPGVNAALDLLAAQGFDFAVCTNKYESASRDLLAHMRLADRFSIICGQDTFAFCKPDPRTLLATIAAAGGDPSRSIMVGDSRTDIDTAKAAGVPVVAVDFGYTDQHVSAFGPNHVISHYDELEPAVALLLAGKIRQPARQAT